MTRIDEFFILLIGSSLPQKRNYCPTITKLPIFLPRPYPIMVDHSTKKITKDLEVELKKALRNIGGWGSVEIFVQDYKVTQITGRNIKKTSLSIRDL